MQHKKQELETNLAKLRKQKNSYVNDTEAINQKRNYIFELLKSQIAMNKIIKRNEQFPAPQDEQKRLPFILIKFMPESKINIL